MPQISFLQRRWKWNTSVLGSKGAPKTTITCIQLYNLSFTHTRSIAVLRFCRFCVWKFVISEFWTSLALVHWHVQINLFERVADRSKEAMLSTYILSNYCIYMNVGRHSELHMLPFWPNGFTSCQETEMERIELEFADGLPPRFCTVLKCTLHSTSVAFVACDLLCRNVHTCYHMLINGVYRTWVVDMVWTLNALFNS